MPEAEADPCVTQRTRDTCCISCLLSGLICCDVSRPICRHRKHLWAWQAQYGNLSGRGACLTDVRSGWVSTSCPRPGSKDPVRPPPEPGARHASVITCSLAAALCAAKALAAAHGRLKIASSTPAHGTRPRYADMCVVDKYACVWFHFFSKCVTDPIHIQIPALLGGGRGEQHHVLAAQANRLQGGLKPKPWILCQNEEHASSRAAVLRSCCCTEAYEHCNVLAVRPSAVCRCHGLGHPRNLRWRIASSSIHRTEVTLARSRAVSVWEVSNYSILALASLQQINSLPVSQSKCPAGM